MATGFFRVLLGLETKQLATTNATSNKLLIMAIARYLSVELGGSNVTSLKIAFPQVGDLRLTFRNIRRSASLYQLDYSESHDTGAKMTKPKIDIHRLEIKERQLLNEIF